MIGAYKFIEICDGCKPIVAWSCLHNRREWFYGGEFFKDFPLGSYFELYYEDGSFGFRGISEEDVLLVKIKTLKRYMQRKNRQVNN
ncbi:MAG: hypothetical protein M0R80_08390 [Proteobacteria bacterium]|jgi:hypothetical protein|nr:hypothetical protein [Pseudomonadota bacterium]